MLTYVKDFSHFSYSNKRPHVTTHFEKLCWLGSKFNGPIFKVHCHPHPILHPSRHLIYRLFSYRSKPNYFIRKATNKKVNIINYENELKEISEKKTRRTVKLGQWLAIQRETQGNIPMYRNRKQLQTAGYNGNWQKLGRHTISVNISLYLLNKKESNYKGQYKTLNFTNDRFIIINSKFNWNLFLFMMNVRINITNYFIMTLKLNLYYRIISLFQMLHRKFL